MRAMRVMRARVRAMRVMQKGKFKNKNKIKKIITNRMNIEITSWKAHAYGIFTRVGEVSEIERVSAANE